MENQSNVCGLGKSQAFVRAGQMHAHCNFTGFTACHPSHPSLPDHPCLLIELVGRSLLVCLRLPTILPTILGICLYLFRVRRGRALLSGFRLRDYDAISITRSRNERCKTTILVGTTTAFDVVGELDGQLLRTFVRRFLGDMTQYEDK